MNVSILALPLVLFFQEPQRAAKQEGTANLEAVFKNLEKEIRALPEVKSREDMTANQKKTKELIEKALADNGDRLNAGDGIHWRGRIQSLGGDRAAALASFEAHAADAKADKKLANASFARGFVMIARDKSQREAADKLRARVDQNALDADLKKSFAEEDMRIKAPDVQTALAGKALPNIPVSHVLNAPAGFDINKSQGKVLVIDYWATWCPPCRQIIPGLIELQKKHGNDGVQVVGATRIYTYGMDFTSESQMPHGGKSVKDIDLATELKTNENFVKTFGVNYPIVVTDIETAIGTFGVWGIPTVFVVGRDGKILGSVVGGGDENHAKLEGLVAQALGKAAPADASAEKPDNKKEK